MIAPYRTSLLWCQSYQTTINPSFQKPKSKFITAVGGHSKPETLKCDWIMIEHPCFQMDGKLLGYCQLCTMCMVVYEEHHTTMFLNDPLYKKVEETIFGHTGYNRKPGIFLFPMTVHHKWLSKQKSFQLPIFHTHHSVGGTEITWVHTMSSSNNCWVQMWSSKTMIQNMVLVTKVVTTVGV